MPVHHEQRLEPQGGSPTATTAPVPVPMQPSERPQAQAGSPADAPLSVSPGTLRVASMSLVTPPSELVTSDMLGAARSTADLPALAEVSVSSGLAPDTGSSTSNMLRIIARGAAVQHEGTDTSFRLASRPAAGSCGDCETQKSLGRAPHGADVTAHSPASGQAGPPARTYSDQAAAEHKPLNVLSPAQPTVDTGAVDGGLLSNFMRAGPHAPLEEVTGSIAPQHVSKDNGYAGRSRMSTACASAAAAATAADLIIARHDFCVAQPRCASSQAALI